MTQVFFLNPTIIQEIVLWRSSTGENLLVFEPVARACSSLGALLVPDDSARAAQLTGILESWCAKADFADLLDRANAARASVSLACARESLSRFSNSDSFVAAVPIDEVLSAFSALIRADLRVRESRSVARLDEIFLWQACLKRFTLHDMTLLVLAAFASKHIMSTFDRLLAIKEEPATLTQIETESLSIDLSAQFTSGMRLFALANYEAAEAAYLQAVDRAPQSPSIYLALSLLYMVQGNTPESLRRLAEAKKVSDSGMLASIFQAINILAGKEEPELTADDPISAALTCFFLLRARRYEQVKAIAIGHLQDFPQDLVMQALLAEALLLPICAEFYNDPPLPGCPDPGLANELDEARIRLSALAQMCKTMDMFNLRGRATTNLSLVCLMQRDFASASDFALSSLSDTPSSPEAKINLSISRLATGDLPRVTNSLNTLPQSLKITGLRLAAEVHYHACSFETALSLWQRILNEEEDRLWRLRTYCRMLEVYRLLQDSENAQTCVNQLLSQFQHEPETLFALAYELWQMERLDDAMHALRRAKDHCAPNLRKWMAWELGRLLFGAGKTLAATDEYVSIADKGVDSVQNREFAVTLYRAGLLPAAYERARAIRLVHGEVVPGITEIEADYLARKQKFVEAKELLRALCLQRPLSVLNRMALIRLCTNLNQEEEARRELDELRRMDLSEEMRRIVERFSNDLELAASQKNGQTT